MNSLPTLVQLDLVAERIGRSLQSCGLPGGPAQLAGMLVLYLRTRTPEVTKVHLLAPVLVGSTRDSDPTRSEKGRLSAPSFVGRLWFAPGPRQKTSDRLNQPTRRPCNSRPE